VNFNYLNIKKMAKLQQHKKQPEAQAAELKATAVLEKMKQLKQPQSSGSNTRRFRDGGIRRCSSSRSDTPVAGEEVKMELKFLKTKDLMRQEASYNQEMRSPDPDPVEIPEERNASR
jgi:hypothetical protein